MYGTSHAGIAATAAVLLRLNNPFGALVLGWGSHYLCDAVPHGDSVPADTPPAQREVWRRRSIDTAVIDGCILIFLWCWRSRRLGHSRAVTASVIGSLFPDLIQIIGRIFGPFAWMRPINLIHGWMHNPLGIILSFWVGLGYQAIMVTLLWGFLLRFGPRLSPVVN